jgi:hypothetical protein
MSETILLIIYSLIPFIVSVIVFIYLVKSPDKDISRGVLIFGPIIAFLGTFIFLALILMLLGEIRFRIETEELRSNLDQFINVPKLINAEQVVHSPQLFGKIVVIDTAEKKMDSKFYFLFPESLRATNPKEVSTVIWFHENKRLVKQEDTGYVMQLGSNPNPVPIINTWYRYICDVTIIDMNIPAITGRKTILGTMPDLSYPTKSNGPIATYGDDTIEEFEEYLKYLYTRDVTYRLKQIVKGRKSRIRNPIRWSAGVMLYDITINDKTITYHYKLDDTSKNDINIETFKEEQMDKCKIHYCDESNIVLIDNNIPCIFSFKDMDDKIIVEIRLEKDDCN